MKQLGILFVLMLSFAFISACEKEKMETPAEAPAMSEEAAAAPAAGEAMTEEAMPAAEAPAAEPAKAE